MNEKISVLVAAVAAAQNHRLSYITPMLKSWGCDATATKPREPSTNPKALTQFAPLCVLEDIELPTSRQSSLQLSRIMRNLLEAKWGCKSLLTHSTCVPWLTIEYAHFCSVPNVKKGTDIFDTRKKLAEYMLNPLGVDANGLAPVSHLFATTDMLMRCYCNMIGPLLPKQLPPLIPSL